MREEERGGREKKRKTDWQSQTSGLYLIFNMINSIDNYSPKMRFLTRRRFLVS